MKNSTKFNCIICQKPVSNKFKPFCSFRCKQIDLYHWLNQDYIITNDEKLENDT